MSEKNQHIVNYLNWYIHSECENQNFAVLIKGGWGSGKTWFIKKFIEDYDNELKKELERIISGNGEEYAMYCSPRKTIRAGKFMFEYFSYPNFKPVLFDRRKCNYVGFVHEILKADGKKKFIPYNILHYKDSLCD